MNDQNTFTLLVPTLQALAEIEDELRAQKERGDDIGISARGIQ